LFEEIASSDFVILATTLVILGFPENVPLPDKPPCNNMADRRKWRGLEPLWIAFALTLDITS
jgi:hypothetical protein